LHVQVLAKFDAELTRIGNGPRVFNVAGVGRIGKSRLLHELEVRARPRFRTALIDLQVPALRRQDDALAVLRGQLGSQHVDFDRFDIAYAVPIRRPGCPPGRARQRGGHRRRPGRVAGQPARHQRSR
jgi:hypothetical protein